MGLVVVEDAGDIEYTGVVEDVNVIESAERLHLVEVQIAMQQGSKDDYDSVEDWKLSHQYFQRLSLKFKALTHWYNSCSWPRRILKCDN